MRTSEKGIDGYLADKYLADRDHLKTTVMYSLLGFLSWGPMSGYRMRQLMEESTSNFWSESFGQIYPALKSMAAEGLIEPVAGEQDRSTSKLYRITDAGRERLHEWLGLPPQRQVPRNELLLKLFFGAHANAAQLRKHLQRYREQLHRDRDRYEEIERNLLTEHAEAPEMPYWRITVRFGKVQVEALLGWCEESLQTLEALEQAGAMQMAGQGS